MNILTFLNCFACFLTEWRKIIGKYAAAAAAAAGPISAHLQFLLWSTYLGMVTHLVLQFCVVIAFSSSSS